MKLKRLKLKNIRSYSDLEIEFPEGSLLLSGDIGSGKTTILLAIEYALFGLQPGQKGSALLRNSADSGEVALEFEVSDKAVIIERKIKRNSKSVTNDYASITVNGKKIESSITEIKTKILNLIGYPQEFIKKNNVLYRYTVYTPQEQMKQIILEDADTRLNILRHVFGIDRYKRIRENLTFLLNRLKEESKVMQFEVQSLETEKEKIAELASSIIKIDSKVSDLNTDLKTKKETRRLVEKEFIELEEKLKERNKIESEIEKAKIVASSKKENLNSTSREIEETNRFLSENKAQFKKEDLDFINSELEKYREDLELMNSNYISSITKLNSLEQLKMDSQEKKDRVFGMNVCPACLQDVSENHKHNIINSAESTLTDLNRSSESLKSEIIKIKKKIEEKKLGLYELEDKKNSILILKSRMEMVQRSNLRLELLNKNKSVLENDISLLLKHIEGLKEGLSVFSKFEGQFRTKKEELKQCFISEKNIEISMAELRKEQDITNNELLKLESSLLKKEEMKIKLFALQELIGWLSNDFFNLIEFTERNMLVRLRREFSTLLNSWFGILAGESFEIQLDESFTPLIMQGEIEMDYSFLSGGERTAVALAYRLALNQTINSIYSTIQTRDLIILDEPTEGFSETQIEKMREVLSELKINQKIIVSHEQKMEGFVESLIKIKKDSGNSSINYVSKE